MTDDTATMTGAEFRRHVGTDADKWAEAFIAAHDRDGVDEMTHPEEVAFTAKWFRDYAEVRVAEEVGRVTARLVPRQE